MGDEQKVYIASSNNAIKIGRSVDPESRVKDMSVGNPNDIELLHVIDWDDMNAAWLEKRLHELLSQEGWDMNGEWFDEKAYYFLGGYLAGVSDNAKLID